MREMTANLNMKQSHMCYNNAMMALTKGIVHLGAGPRQSRLQIYTKVAVFNAPGAAVASRLDSLNGLPFLSAQAATVAMTTANLSLG